MPECRIKIDGKEIEVNHTPILIEVFTNHSCEVVHFFCYDKEYVVKINPNLKLQMIGNGNAI